MLTVDVISDVDGPVRPSFLALASLPVVNPLPFVAGPVEMSVDAVPMRFVIYPFSVVNISVTIFEFMKRYSVAKWKISTRWKHTNSCQNVANFYHEILKSFKYKG